MSCLSTSPYLMSWTSSSFFSQVCMNASSQKRRANSDVISPNSCIGLKLKSWASNRASECHHNSSIRVADPNRRESESYVRYDRPSLWRRRVATDRRSHVRSWRVHSSCIEAINFGGVGFVVITAPIRPERVSPTLDNNGRKHSRRIRMSVCCSTSDAS